MEKIYIVDDANKKNFLLNKNTSSSNLMSYQSVIKNLYFDFREDAIYDIVVNKNVTKEIAQIYLKNMYYLQESNRKRIKFLLDLKKELMAKNLLIFNPFFKQWISQYELVFYHISKKDKFFWQTVEILKQDCKVEIEDCLKTSFIGKLAHEKTLDDEVIGVCLEIVKLLKRGVDYHHIYLTNLNEEYIQKFQFYGKIFNIPFNLKNNQKIYSTMIINEFIQNITKPWDQVLTDLKTHLTTNAEVLVYESLVNLCNKYVLYKKNEQFYQYFLECLKELKIKNNNDGIKGFDFLKEEVAYDDYVFVVGANEGELPKAIKDIGYFNDFDLRALKMSDTKEQNEIILKETIARLKSYSNLVISYKEKNGNLEYFPASILECLQTTKINFESNRFSYSHLFNLLNYGKLYDTYLKYGINDSNLALLVPIYEGAGYRSFNNQVQLPTVVNQIKKFSYTSLDTYQKCPYRFYLNYILKVNDYQETFAILLGRFYHAVLSRIYQENDLDLIIMEEQQIFKNLTASEKFFLKKLTDDLRKTIYNIKEQEQCLNYSKVLCEEKFEINLFEDYILEGIIDKIYLSDETISLIDYKTGKANVDLSYLSCGLNLQLPIYLLLIKNSQFHDWHIAGFYLQKFLRSLVSCDFKHDKDYLEKQALKLQGYSNDNESVIKNFDTSYKDSKVVHGLKVSSKGFYAYSKVLSDEQIEDLITYTKGLVEKTIKEIAQGNFQISPKRIDGELKSCEYCPYQNICYRKEEDILNLKKEELSFLKKKEKINV